jgi:tetratricopeptide (TPR) repeat protein
MDNQQYSVVIRTFVTHHRRRLLLLVGLIAVVAIAIAAVTSADRHRPTSPQASIDSQLPKTVGKLIHSGQYNQAIAAIQSAPDPSSESSQLLKAAVYVNQQRYAQALDIYQALVTKFGGSESLEVATAQTALLAQQPTIARTAYQQAIDLLEQQPATTLVQKTIAELQAALLGVKA